MPTAPIRRGPGRPPKPTRKPPGLSPRVRDAVDLMAYKGFTRQAAAAAVGMLDKSLYHAFCNPDVKGYYNQGCEAVRTGEKARSLHAAVVLRERGIAEGASAAEGRNALDASKWIYDDPQPRAGMNVNISITPGYVLDVRDLPRGPVIDADEIIRIDGMETAGAE